MTVEANGSDATRRVVRSDAVVSVQRESADAMVAPAGNDPAAAEAHKAEAVFDPGASFYPPNLPEGRPQSPSIHGSRRWAWISAAAIAVVAVAFIYVYHERPASAGRVEPVASPAAPPITHTPKATQAAGLVAQPPRPAEKAPPRAPATDTPVAVVPRVTHTQPLPAGAAPAGAVPARQETPPPAPRIKDCSEQAAVLGLCK